MAGPITPWVSQTHPTKDGEEVRQNIDNRLPLELQQRTQHLKDRLDALDAGQALFARAVSVSSDVKLGHAVYWDAVDQQYKPAIARVDFSSVLGGFITAASSYVVGICAFKYNATKADICMIGLIDSFDFTFGIGTAGNTAAEGGAYYLSASQAGTYTKQQPPVGVFVAFLRGDGSAHVIPTPRELLEQHIHYAVDLFAVPAGTIQCAAPPGPYTFISPDPTVPGWLPADHPIFSGLAPAGAVYGYNLSQHPELNRLWPPLPPETAYLEVNGIGTTPDTFLANAHGLWWLKDCYGKAPWPASPQPCGIPVPSSSSSSSSNSSSSNSSVSSSIIALLCDPNSLLEQLGFIKNDPVVKYMKLFFTKMVFKDNIRAVTSLAPYPGSPIRVLGCDGLPANRGDLKLALDLGANIITDEVAYTGLKDVTGFVFRKGFICTGLRQGRNVTLTPVIDAEGQKGALVGQTFRGELLIDAASGSVPREGGMELVALNGVREESDADVFYISFPQNIATSFRLRIGLPFADLPADSKMKLWFWLLAKGNGAPLPPLGITYRILRRPTPPTIPNDCDVVALALTDTALVDIDKSNCGLLAPDTYVEAFSAVFPAVGSLKNGDMILATLSRPVDAYPGDVGVMRMGYTLV